MSFDELQNWARNIVSFWASLLSTRQGLLTSLVTVIHQGRTSCIISGARYLRYTFVISVLTEFGLVFFKILCRKVIKVTRLDKFFSCLSTNIILSAQTKSPGMFTFHFFFFPAGYFWLLYGLFCRYNMVRAWGNHCSVKRSAIAALGYKRQRSLLLERRSSCSVNRRGKKD